MGKFSLLYIYRKGCKIGQLCIIEVISWNLDLDYKTGANMKEGDA